MARGFPTSARWLPDESKDHLSSGRTFPGPGEGLHGFKSDRNNLDREILTLCNLRKTSLRTAEEWRAVFRPQPDGFRTKARTTSRQGGRSQVLGRGCMVSKVIETI